MLYRTVVLASALVLGATAANANGYAAQKTIWEGLRNNPPITHSPLFEGRSATAASKAVPRNHVQKPARKSGGLFQKHDKGQDY